MNEDSHYISVGNERMHYLKWGSGKRLLLAFHGYGDDAEQYRPLEQYLVAEYTILSIDLPHHGRSSWNEAVALTKNDLISVVRSLMADFHVDKVSLLGYSMGGRIGLAILERMPESVDKVALLATDGLTVNSYYYFFTKTFIGRRMFRNMLQKPGRYLKIIDWLRNWKMVDPARHKFVMHFLQHEDGRNFLLKVWPSMSDIISTPEKLRAAIVNYKIPVSIFMGAYDKIMPPLIAEQFRKGLDTVQLHVLEKGHRVLDNENARQIAESLL